MTLATRCSACGTIFRVVQDQLRVSQGWVRCGRCGEPFNALESMVDLPPPRLPPPAAPEPASAAAAAAETVAAAPVPAASPPVASVAPPPAEPAAAPAVQAPAEAPALPMIDLPAGIELIASDGAVGEQADVPRTASEAPAAAAVPSEGTGSSPGASVPVVLPSSVAAVAAPGGLVGDGVAARTAAPMPEAAQPFSNDAAPSFIVKAERAARWRHPGVRAALIAGVLLALFGLAAQFTYVFRDHVAATLPALRPWLQQACAATIGCRIDDLRLIEALSVESSGLVRVEGSPVYRLSVTLRNRAAIEVAAPAIDLALNDAQGRAIARRVLTMADLELPLRTLKAGSELPIQVPLGIGDRQVSGYTVELFYP